MKYNLFIKFPLPRISENGQATVSLLPGLVSNVIPRLGTYWNVFLNRSIYTASILGPHRQNSQKKV